jgi:hypothetical protein
MDIDEALELTERRVKPWAISIVVEARSSSIGVPKQGKAALPKKLFLHLLIAIPTKEVCCQAFIHRSLLIKPCYNRFNK